MAGFILGRVRPSAEDESTIAVENGSEPEAVGEQTSAAMVSEPVVEPPRPPTSPTRRIEWIWPAVIPWVLVLAGFSAVVVVFRDAARNTILSVTA